MQKLKVSKPLRHLSGSELHCKNWQIEGILRMLYNMVDSEVAKGSESLLPSIFVYG